MKTGTASPQIESGKLKDQTLEKFFTDYLHVFGHKPEDYERMGNTWTPRGEFLSPEPGVVFRKTDGKLFVFGKDEVMVLKALPQPRAWIKSRSFPYWRSVRPSSFPPRWQGRTACRRYISRVALPPRAREIVENCHPSVGWGIMKLLATEPIPALELCTGGFPALLALVYYHFLFNRAAPRGREFDVSRRLLRQRRRDILQFCGFPADCVNILRHIPHEAVSLVSLLSLRNALNHHPGVKKQLLHLSDDVCLTKRAFIALSSYPQYLTQSLIRVLGTRQGSGVANLIRDIEEMRKLIGLPGRQEGLRSLKEVKSAHLRMAVKLDEVRLQEMVFAQPPLEDGEVVVGKTRVSIRSLSSGVELARHGSRASNCAAIYAQEACDGSAWMMEASSTPWLGLHTVCIRPGSDGRWGLAEIANEKNETANPVVRDAVLQFLSSQQQHPPATLQELPAKMALDINNDLLHVGEDVFDPDEDEQVSW